jgi:hypothetical protein
MPSDAPPYGRASEIRPAVERLIEREAAIWVPIVLRWGCEIDDDLAEFTRLAKLAAPIARSWHELLQPPD